ncbi:protein Ycf2-like [Syzygium oleosum]|uniref:protein Ycf2-like n=1 Tax=Syzygium oleosum TaxID=219896 RepID=UPI0024BA6A1D|nr:protein Ycf2-like [Syzygium oleosum]
MTSLDTSLAQSGHQPVPAEPESTVAEPELEPEESQAGYDPMDVDLDEEPEKEPEEEPEEEPERELEEEPEGEPEVEPEEELEDEPLIDVPNNSDDEIIEIEADSESSEEQEDQLLVPFDVSGVNFRSQFVCASGPEAQERAATIAHAAEAAAINGNNGNQGQGQVNANRQMHQLVEQFLKLKPLKFDGKGDPEAASLWVEELEKAFEVLGCTEEEKGQMSVDQYKAEFSRLSKFAPRMVKDPLDKARRFRDGLKPDLRSQMISLNLRDYNEIYEWAQGIERDLADRAAASGLTWCFREGLDEFGPVRGFDVPFDGVGDWDPSAIPPPDGQMTSLDTSLAQSGHQPVPAEPESTVAELEPEPEESQAGYDQMDVDLDEEPEEEPEEELEEEPERQLEEEPEGELEVEPEEEPEDEPPIDVPNDSDDEIIEIEADSESSEEQEDQGESDSGSRETDSEWTPLRGRRG